ncbi:MAG: hypothetical protein GY851_03020 [bacterium]|nr:hypothetical protein [bacterium]
MSDTIEQLEARLDDFDPKVRSEALGALIERTKTGEIELPEPRPIVNMHCHTCYSFNGYGYSPTCLAWKARKAGLAVASIVDFDVLDAVDEFLNACALLGLRGSAGIETRTFLPEFATREMNSPGEPGVAYHIGVGFTSNDCADDAMLVELRGTARDRNLGMIERVNAYLDPVALDYEKDVLPFTPAGNATERHLAMAYEAKGRECFPDDADRTGFWADRLGVTPTKIAEASKDSPAFQGLIRSKLMKSGGVGYVKPGDGDFPQFRAVNDFILGGGAVPVVGWLDGFSQGEQDIEELVDTMLGMGAAAISIIPDRNWNLADADLRAKKVAKLHEIVDLATGRDLPILVGTEMNAHGQPFVDNFDAPEMAPLVQPALDGAYILYAHTMLQSHQGMGYLSSWADAHFDSAAAKNTFYAALGRALDPANTRALDRLGPEVQPDQVLKEIS